MIILPCLNTMVNVDFFFFVLVGNQYGWVQSASSNQPPVSFSDISVLFTKPLQYSLDLSCIYAK